MNAASLFSGIGTFELGFARAGIDTEWMVEINGSCRAVLGHHYPDTSLYRDITNLGTRWLTKRHGEIDVIFGGFPCQDVSVAGHRAGLDAPRSGLWWEFHRLLDEARPPWCVIENVAGLLSSRGGRDLGAILRALGDLGYGWAYRVLDAQWFGVAQRRRRVFIVGCHRDARRASAVLLEPESGGGNPAASGAAREDVAETIEARTRGGGFPGTEDDVAPTVNTFEGHNESRATVLLAFHLTQDPISGDIAPAVSTGNQQGCATIGVLGADGVRRLMPIEVERLFGLPDDWTLVPDARGKPMSDNQRYKMLGNAAAVPVLEWIGRRIVEHA